MSQSLDILKADRVVDARNSPCPGPLLAVKQSITDVEVGQIVELLSTDRGALSDIPAWAKKSGNEYLGTVPHDDYDSHFLLRRK